ncbi:MAG: hypothetical protein AB1515_09105, partial [Nitrospirota bacterium]
VVTYRVSNRPNLESVAMLNTDADPQADDGWATGEGGVLFRYDLRADPLRLTWSQWTLADNNNTPLPTQGLKAVSMRNSGEGWAVGDGGAIYRFSNNRWQAAASPTARDLTAVSITPGGEGMAVGENGEVLIYNPNQGSWVRDPTAGANLTAIKAFSDAKGWGAGEQGTIIRKLGGVWADPGDSGTVVPPGVGNTNLRGIDMLPQQSNVTDWRESN